MPQSIRQGYQAGDRTPKAQLNHPMTAPPPPDKSQILTGPLFNEPMRVETVTETGPDAWTLGLVGTRSERFRRVSLRAAELAALTVLDSRFRYDGDGALLRLGLQAHALGIAWEFDPYFGLSVSRVDPLPHQLEAVYDHLLKLPRVRFLLADDAGAGKTIMAGLLIRELQLRGLAERILIVRAVEPRVPVATRAAGEVRRDVHGTEGQRAARPVRREPVDATAEGRDLARSRQARGNPARPAAGALGPSGGGRGPPNVGP